MESTEKKILEELLINTLVRQLLSAGSRAGYISNAVFLDKTNLLKVSFHCSVQVHEKVAADLGLKN